MELLVESRLPSEFGEYTIQAYGEKEIVFRMLCCIGDWTL